MDADKQVHETESVTGVVLAGGQNRRMGGQVKAFLAVEGESFLLRQVKEMAGSCSEILIVTQNPPLYAAALESGGDKDWPVTVRIVPDLVPARGPLGGLHSALHTAKSDLLWVVGCDMPLISSRAAGELVKILRRTGAAAAVPRIGGKVHPLHGIYRKDILPQVEQMLEAGDYRMMGVFQLTAWEAVDEVVWNKLGVTLEFVRNINTPDEYDELLRDCSLFP
ncbi:MULTISPECIES: molybdenum cofactor guanylyltransferase [Paenibacillus]|uniref:molybdenum cofactor guanylyltransferase n=1 Tax=Paenibacillus TaxID=44249 RepID=UPI0022B85C57|nr:molybdenum cofactor guanylyltransferase [Paenibacillus caseinilyticus]MCZ8522869.1 molybdenum cofactor guanylyltransferase [Paenibacillus caseinilyticus]